MFQRSNGRSLVDHLSYRLHTTRNETTVYLYRRHRGSKWCRSTHQTSTYTSCKTDLVIGPMSIYCTWLSSRSSNWTCAAATSPSLVQFHQHRVMIVNFWSLHLCSSCFASHGRSDMAWRSCILHTWVCTFARSDSKLAWLLHSRIDQCYLA